MKAVNQVLVAGSYAAVAEAMLWENGSTYPWIRCWRLCGGQPAPGPDHRAAGMLVGSYPLGFRLALHHKDLGIALDAAESAARATDQPPGETEHDLMQGGTG